MIRIEIAVDDVGGAAAAQAGGADRVELCAGLGEGGTTPTPGFVLHSRMNAPHVDAQVLVRPRPGDFVYSRAELDVMVSDIEVILERLSTETAVPESTVGFTVGALTARGEVDGPATSRLVAACGPAPVVFHKAFDSVADQAAALRQLADLGVAKVLTSGGVGPATDHLDALRTLVELAGDEIDVVVGGSVRPQNVAAIVRATGAGEVHLRAPRVVPSASLSGPSQYDEGGRVATDPAVVAAVRAALTDDAVQG